MSKNAYELRSDILAMAKDYMDKQVELNIEYSRQLERLGEGMAKTLYPSLAKIYNPTFQVTVKDWLDVAHNLYKFVEAPKDSLQNGISESTKPTK